jgi:hypothetical protein
MRPTAAACALAQRLLKPQVMRFLRPLRRFGGRHRVAALQRLWVFGEAGSDRLPRLHASTGHPGLDALLQGGFACGELTEIVGAAQVGKTTLALQAVVAAQLRHRAPCLLVDCSCTLSASLALAAGADARRTLLLRPPVLQGAPAAAAGLAKVWNWLCGSAVGAAAPAAADESFWAMCCMAIQQTGASLMVLDTPDVLGLPPDGRPPPNVVAGQLRQQATHAAWRGPQAMLQAAARHGCAVVATAQRAVVPKGAATAAPGAVLPMGPPTALSAHAAVRVHLLAKGQPGAPMQAVPSGFVCLSPPTAQHPALFAGVTKNRPIFANT